MAKPLSAEEQAQPIKRVPDRHYGVACKSASRASMAPRSSRRSGIMSDFRGPSKKTSMASKPRRPTPEGDDGSDSEDPTVTAETSCSSSSASSNYDGKSSSKRDTTVPEKELFDDDDEEYETSDDENDGCDIHQERRDAEIEQRRLFEEHRKNYCAAKQTAAGDVEDDDEDEEDDEDVDDEDDEMTQILQGKDVPKTKATVHSKPAPEEAEAPVTIPIATHQAVVQAIQTAHDRKILHFEQVTKKQRQAMREARLYLDDREHRHAVLAGNVKYAQERDAAEAKAVKMQLESADEGDSEEEK